MTQEVRRQLIAARHRRLLRGQGLPARLSQRETIELREAMERGADECVVALKYGITVAKVRRVVMSDKYMRMALGGAGGEQGYQESVLSLRRLFTRGVPGDL